MTVIRGYVDDNFSGRDWNLASAHGHQRRGRLPDHGRLGQGRVPERRQGARARTSSASASPARRARSPSTPTSSRMFKQGDEATPAAGRAGHGDHVARRSSRPSTWSRARSRRATDVSERRLRRLRQEGHGGPRRGHPRAATLFGSMAHGHANPASVKNAIYDVITAHFNGEYDSATAAAGAGRRRSRSRSDPLIDRGGRLRPARPSFNRRSDRPWPSLRPRGRTGASDWLRDDLPKLVLSPSLAVVLVFVYGFILFTVYLSFTDSRMLPSLRLGRAGRTTSGCSALRELVHRDRQPRDLRLALHRDLQRARPRAGDPARPEDPRRGLHPHDLPLPDGAVASS